MDSIGGRGRSRSILIDQYYVLPCWSPTQASLLLGNYPLHHGIHSYIEGYSYVGLPLDVETLPNMLKRSNAAVGDDCDDDIQRDVMDITKHKQFENAHSDLSLIWFLLWILSGRRRIVTQIVPIEVTFYNVCRNVNLNCWHTCPFLQLQIINHQSHKQQLQIKIVSDMSYTTVSNVIDTWESKSVVGTKLFKSAILLSVFESFPFCWADLTPQLFLFTLSQIFCTRARSSAYLWVSIWHGSDFSSMPSTLFKWSIVPFLFSAQGWKCSDWNLPWIGGKAHTLWCQTRILS